MSKKNVFVLKDPNGWRIQAGKTTISTHQKQERAIEKAKPLAKRLATDLVIQGRDGKFRSKDSYGNDPIPPRDREH